MTLHADNSMARRVGRAGVVAAFAASLIVATATATFAVTMIAADAPTTVTIAPGATGAVPWTVKNTGGGAGIANPGGSTVVFQAPGNTTFAAQTTVPVQFSSDGTTFGANNYQLTSCVLSNGNKTLTCQGSSANGGNSGWPANTFFRFLPQVTVDADAPAGTTLTPGTSTFNYLDANRSNAATDTSVGTLNVATPAVAAVPIADPRLLAASVVAGLFGLFWWRRRSLLSSQH